MKIVKNMHEIEIDRKLKSINPNVKNIENPSRTTAARLPKIMK